MSAERKIYFAAIILIIDLLDQTYFKINLLSINYKMCIQQTFETAAQNKS